MRYAGSWDRTVVTETDEVMGDSIMPIKGSPFRGWT